ncbi:hypothetical protein BH11CYA1_BH11CYA1_00690 [soil metagenome]
MNDKFETDSSIAGTYKVLGFIGEGAMGLVYKVEHSLLNKILALKVLKTEHLTEVVWQRFRLEALAIARLDHPNIVKIYDMSQTAEGLPFYTMDLLVGQSLADYIQDYGPVPVEDALPLFRQVCAALAYANDHGILHRDIKPGNIMLLTSQEGSIKKCAVKIVDFGIAKLIDDGTNSLQGLTKPGEVFGSPLYMSPEQCMGSKLDQRSDMYSVGITMFQALTGRPPLLGKSAVETAALHQSQEAPLLSDIAPEKDFPMALEDVIATMLEKAPDNRYSSLAEVASELLKIERSNESQTQNHSEKQSPNQGSRYQSRRQRQTEGYDKHSLFEDEYDHEEDSDEQRNDSNKLLTTKQKVAIGVILGIALVLITSATAVTLWPKAKEQQAKIVEAFDSPLASATGEKSDENDLLDSSQRKAISSYIASHKDKYSQLKTIDKKLYRVFEFPEKFSLGTLSYAFGKTRPSATGTVMVPAKSKLKLEASGELECYPELLLGFRPDDISWFAVKDVNPRNPNLAPNIVHLTSLKALEIKGCKIDGSDLKTLEQLQNLTLLNLSQTVVRSADLANCSLLEHLVTLQTEYLDEPSALLMILAKYNSCMILDLRHSTLTKQDIATLSQMTNLDALTLKECDLNDADIEALSSLPRLRFINIDNSKKLTINCLSSLAKFASLEKIVLPNHLQTEPVEKRLKKLAPQLKLVQTSLEPIGQIRF